MADESLLVSVPPWNWSASNGSATAAQTAAAYTALTTGGRTSAFSAAVWNDILSKISAQRLDWGDTAWNEKIAKLADTKMSRGMGMTADKFNSAVINIPISNYVWPWEASLGRSAIKKGDRCYGMYFVYLTDGINHWIDLAPIPIDVVADFYTVSGMDSHVLNALHVLPAWTMSHRVKSVVTARAPMGVPVHIENVAYQTGRAFIEFLYTMEVHIAHFMRHRPELSVTMYPADHVIINNDVRLRSGVTLSYNNTLNLLLALRATLAHNVRVESDPTFPIKINTGIGNMTGRASLFASQLIDLIFNLDVTVGGEPWIREAFSEPMQALLDVSAPIAPKVSFNDTDVIKAVLEAIAHESVHVTAHEAEKVRAALNETLRSNAYVQSAPTNRITADGVIDFQSQFALSLGLRSYLRGALSSAVYTSPGVTIHRADLVKAALIGAVKSGVKFSAQDALFIKALLESAAVESVRVKEAPAKHIQSVLAFMTALDTKLLTAESVRIVANVVQAFKSKTGMFVKDAIPFITYVRSNSGLKAASVIKPTTHAICGIFGSYTINTSIRAMTNMHSGTYLNLRFNIGSSAHVFKSPHTGTKLTDSLCVATKAIVRRGVVYGAEVYQHFSSMGTSVLTRPAYFSSALTDILAVRATGIVARLDSRRTKAALNVVSDGRATITMARFICLSASTVSGQTGNAALTLREQVPVTIYAAIEHSSSATLNAVPAGHVKFTVSAVYNAALTLSTKPTVHVGGILSVIQTGTVNISIIGPTLASELDDILVSDLDDTLVTEIEFRF